MPNNSAFCDVPTALDEIRAGRMIVVIDDEDRENEGDLTMAAEKITPEAINFMAKFGRGLICLAMTEERLDYLRLGPMSPENTSHFGTAFTESIDAREGVTTGISASRPRPHHPGRHRSRDAPQRSRASRPHLPAPRPQRWRPGPRRQTEASVDLARLAGLVPAGVICEIMNDDGTMARVPELAEFCRQHNLKMLTVAELIRYRMAHERYVRRLAEAVVPTAYGEFRMIAYESEINGETHIALVTGDVEHATDEPCSSACTRIASWETSSAPPGASAATPSTAPCAASPRRAEARSSICTRPRKGYSIEQLGRAHDHAVPSRAAHCPRCPKASAARSAKSASARRFSLTSTSTHPPAHQPSPQSRRPGRLRHRDRRTGSVVGLRQGTFTLTPARPA